MEKTTRSKNLLKLSLSIQYWKWKPHPTKAWVQFNDFIYACTVKASSFYEVILTFYSDISNVGSLKFRISRQDSDLFATGHAITSGLHALTTSPNRSLIQPHKIKQMPDFIE